MMQVLTPFYWNYKARRFEQQSEVFLQDDMLHALTDIDAVKATTTARKEKRIVFSEMIWNLLRGILNKNSEDGGYCRKTTSFYILCIVTGKHLNQFGRTDIAVDGRNLGKTCKSLSIDYGHCVIRDIRFLSFNINVEPQTNRISLGPDHILPRLLVK